MKTLNAAEACDQFPDLLDRVAKEGERVAIKRGRKVVAVLVPPKDLAILEELEDRLDAEDAERAWREFQESGEEAIPYEQVRKELGLP